MATVAGLPERDRVPWRALVDEASLRRSARAWSATSAMHAVPFVLAAVLVLAVNRLLAPIALVLLVHAWAIPGLYAARGAGVLRPRAGAGGGGTAGLSGGDGAHGRALLLLGDLVDERSRALHAATGLVLEPGRLGIWVLGEGGALLVRPGGRRVNCYCVRATGDRLPAADRIAHLLLALRCDEAGFATVANLAFSGACWRLRRKLPHPQRPALDAAQAASRLCRTTNSSSGCSPDGNGSRSPVRA